MLDLRGVSKSYAGVTALATLDLVAPQGKTTVLIGSSGCGKSTILRLMVGLLQPDTGEVWFGNERLTPDNAIRLRQRMGYVIQDGGLFPHLTARENVTLLAKHLKWDEKSIDARVRELSELTRLPWESLDRYPTEISGGQRQRVSLMRALMLNPEVLLLDEPLGALDPIIRSELQSDLRDAIRALGKTVVLVTHDIGEAWYLGDDLVLLREGAIVQRGTLDDMLKAPADPFVTRFINAQRGPSL